MLLVLYLFFIGIHGQCPTSPGTVIGDGNIGTAPAQNPTDCCAACNANPACQAWTFESDSVTCWLKDNQNQGGAKTGATSGTSTPGPPPPPPPPPPPKTVNAWPQFNGDAARTGINSKENYITASNVKNLVSLWNVTVPDLVDSSPIYLANVNTASGVKDLLFFNSRSGQVFSLDAATGAVVWRANNITVSGVIMSSPALDPNLKYVYAYRQDGKIHKYRVEDGTEDSTLGFPATISLIQNVEKGSSAINIAKGYLYMTISGYYGDGGHYTGHVVAINLSTGGSTVFNVLCTDKRELLGSNSGAENYCPQAQAGVWGRGGAVEDPDDGSIYISSGNGLFNADQGGLDYGDSLLRLKAGIPNGTNVLIDSYTPVNASKLQSEDLDLGSVSAICLPVESTSKTPYLLVQFGKDQVLRLLNRRDFSGQNKPGQVGGEVQIVGLAQGGEVQTLPLAWRNPTSNITWIFAQNGNGFSAYTVQTDTNGITTMKNVYVNRSLTGSSPFMANNILFLQGTSYISAVDPTTGTVLWQGATTNVHWQSPIVVNGIVYLVDHQSHARAYGFK